jgi:outer membrane receptor protein involved in Fe transport
MLMDAQPFARLDLAYVGKMVTSLPSIESVVDTGRIQRQDSYETGDFRIGLEGERWSTSLFVDNIWDERAITFRNNRWAVKRFTMMRPRTFGIQYRYNF